ncbi:F-box domain-containing protein [Caenorhabditis elegans]|uniref:F-box domain-containing protein n=1 Tax=Caenorhabditis elegans TaxID=6239 RepID=Q95QB9_CAEEL|nr:F-box domain-containing protein [Caenorhabditis elegans]CCD62916.1 F-box domain-containing protein [Caenorhabditis elegans]|eukprot:NP_508096.3 Uncharacterized protein CELE_R04A9.6 [Caenorhabditis elegans]
MPDQASFRTPKRKTSHNYELEIRKIVESVAVPSSSVSSSPTGTEITSYKQLFDDFNEHFRVEMESKQVFLGGQQISMRTNCDHTMFFIINTESKVVLTFGRHYVSLPFAEIVKFTIYRSTRFGFRHAMLLHLTSRGSEIVIEKFQSLKYRLLKYHDDGVGPDYIDLQKKTLIVSLAERNVFASTPVAVLRSLSENGKAFQVNEGNWIRIFQMIKIKLRRNNNLELNLEQFDEYEMEETMNTLGLSWLKTDNIFEMKDRNHLLNMIPTMFMESTLHGVCELTRPDHLMRPLARKRMLIFTDDLEMRSSNPKQTYAVKNSSEHPRNKNEEGPSQDFSKTPNLEESFRGSIGYSLLASLISDDSASTHLSPN